MRIERIVATRFGPLRDLELALALPRRGGVVVVEGPNEAGKSTLLRFINAMLFGGAPAHGALVVNYGGGHYRLEQRGARGTLVLTDLGTGRPVEPPLLQRMVGNLDGKVYHQVFAFGLEELQAISTLTGDGVQERIFSAAVAGAGRSVREVQRDLAKEIDGLWRPRSASRIRAAARELRAAVALVHEAERAAADWPRLSAEEEDLAARITEQEHRLDTARADLRRTELLLELHDGWSRRRTALARLAAAPDGASIPGETVQRLATLRTEVEVLSGQAADLAKQVADLEPAASAAVPHEALLPLADRLSSLLADVPVQRQRLEEDLPRSATALQAAEGLLATALAPLGEGWTEERIAAFPLSVLRAAEITSFAEAFEALSRRRIQSETSHEASTEVLQQERAQVDARRAAGADLDWLQAEGEIRTLGAAAGAHRSRLERLERVGAELRQATASLEGVLARLGPAWDEDRALEFAAHAQWRRAGEEAAALAETAADERRKGHMAVDAAVAQVRARRDDLSALTRPTRAAAEVEREVRALRAEVAGLEELGGTLPEWREAHQEVAAAAAAVARAAGAAADRRSGGWIRAVIALGLPLSLAVWLVRPEPLGAAALVVLAAVLTALYGPRRVDSVAQAELERLQTVRHDAERHLEAIGRRVKELADAAGLADVDLARVRAALSTVRGRQGDLEGELAACRTWEAAAEALRQSEQRYGAARTQADLAGQAEADAQVPWRAWCQANGLPSHIRPLGVPAFLSDIERAQELAQLARAARAESETLRLQVDGWRRRVQVLAERLPAAQALSPEQAIDALQGELERAAELRRAVQSLEEAERRHTEAVRWVGTGDQAYADLRERWGAWCGEAGLPEMAGPEDARVWARDARVAADRAANVQGLRAAAAALHGRSAQWEAKASALLRDAGRAVTDVGLVLVAAISGLAADLRQAEAGVGEREQARATGRRFREDLQAMRTLIKTKETEIAKLLASCGAASEPDLAERLQWQAKRQEWQRVVREAEDELGRRAGQDAEAIGRLLSEDAPLRWREEADRLRQQLSAWEAGLNDREEGLRTRVGALRSRREALEVSGDVARHRLETERCKQVLAEALRRWVVCRLADALIGDTLKEYERSHVPEVVRSASERFARVTGGRYRSVQALEGGRLRVTTGEDAVLNAADLSRGTQEQLYLVVRLGLVDSFSRQSESLPLILDDVLVNSDPERQEGLIRALVDASDDHQTIVLTCHPQATAAIQRQAPGAQVVRLGRIVWAGQSAGRAAAAAAEPRDGYGTEAPGSGEARAEVAAAAGDLDGADASLRAALREHPGGLTSGQLCAASGHAGFEGHDPDGEAHDADADTEGQGEGR